MKNIAISFVLLFPFLFIRGLLLGHINFLGLGKKFFHSKKKNFHINHTLFLTDLG